MVILHLEDLAEAIRDGKIKNVVVLTGAGISTSCGIKDFRSPDGAFATIVKEYPELALEPEKAFSRSFFRTNPKPFLKKSRPIMDPKIRPGPGHFFIRLLQDKGLLKRLYTRNVDGLDRMAGILPSKLVEAHGSYSNSTCRSCRSKFENTRADVWNQLEESNDGFPRCPKCGGDVMYDIVLYEDPMPDYFKATVEQDFPKHGPPPCDLLLVLGTSLQVAPFCALPNLPDKTCVRVLVNIPISDALFNPFNQKLRGESFATVKFNKRLVPLRSLWRNGKWESEMLIEETTDQFCQRFAEMLGWGPELSDLILQG